MHRSRISNSITAIVPINVHQKKAWICSVFLLSFQFSNDRFALRSWLVAFFWMEISRKMLNDLRYKSVLVSLPYTTNNEQPIPFQTFQTEMREKKKNKLKINNLKHACKTYTVIFVWNHMEFFACHSTAYIIELMR